MDAESADGAALKDNFIDSTPTPPENLQRSERQEAVKAAIAMLPPELREPLILAVYEGMSQAEIGEILDCSAKAVETRIYRARNQLREKLGELVAA
jgi:RNA polymerase sigma-70 factor (ECF subfamily)